MNLRLERIKLHKSRQAVDLSFSNGDAGTLSAEYLRVFSPSAEVRGHGLDQPMLVLGKEQVRIQAIEPVGRYAVKLVFDDGHDSGLYDWDTLHELYRNHDAHWADYLGRLENVGISRDEAAATTPATASKAEEPATYDVLAQARDKTK